MGSNEIVTKQCSAVLKAAHSAANGTEKGLNFELQEKIIMIWKLKSIDPVDESLKLW